MENEHILWVTGMNGAARPVVLISRAPQHVYVIDKQARENPTLLRNLILQDIEAGRVSAS